MAEFPFAATLDRLQSQLKTAGIPLTGISPRQPAEGESPHFTDRGQGFFVELHFGPSVTAPQRALAAQLNRTRGWGIGFDYYWRLNPRFSLHAGGTISRFKFYQPKVERGCSRRL